MGAASDAEPLGVAGARPSVRNGQRLFTGVPMSICFWARKKAAPEELFEAGGSGNAEGLTVFDKRVVFPIGERLRADALSFEGPVLGHGRDGRGVACRENEAASKEGCSAEGFPSRPCAVSPARGARRKGANMDISQCLLCMNAPKGFRSLRRGSETCTAHKIQKSPYATIREKRWGNVRQERKAGGDAAISTPPTVTGTYSPTADGVRSCLKSDGGNETWGTFCSVFHKAIIAGHWNVKGV